MQGKTEKQNLFQNIFFENKGVIMKMLQRLMHEWSKYSFRGILSSKEQAAHVTGAN
jgi:hypothetical protein